MLSSTEVRRLAAGKALEWGQARGTVAKVAIDGTAVALPEAQAALDEVSRFVPPQPGLIDRWADTLDGKLQGLKTRLADQPLAKKALEVIDVDRERLATRVQVEVAFADGRTEKVTIEVVDVKTTKLLNLLSAAAELGSITPLVGNAVLPVAALLTTAGAKLTAWYGPADLADALQRIALKEWVLAGAAFVPGVGTVAGLLAATRDLNDKADVQAAPPVSVIA